MSETTPAPQSNRTPWIIAGVLGCLVLCLLVAVVGGGIYFLTQPRTTTGLPTNAPVIVQPSSASSASSAPSSVKPPVVSSSASSVSSVLSSAQPPVVSSSASSAVQPPATSSATSSAQPPVVSSSASTVSSAASKPAAGPTGKIAFSKNLGDRPEDKEVWIANADGTNAKKILDRASHPILSPDGTKIVYYRWTDGLFIANVDGTDAKKLVGDTFTGGNYGSGDWSNDGRFIIFNSQPGGRGNIIIDRVNLDGTNRVTVVVGEAPSYSPDDTQIAFHTCRGPCGIYKSSANPGSEAVPVITDDGGLANWSPDGRRILYQKEVDGQKQLFVINVDGSGKKQLTSGAFMHVDGAWSTDGNFIFYRSPEGGTWGIWVMTADGANPRKLIDNVVPVNWPYERLAVSK